MASPLAGKAPTILNKGFAGLPSADGGEAGHGGSGDGDFYETGFHGEWHPQLCANFQTAENGLVDVYRRLVFSFALTDATGNGWAFGDPDAVLIAVQYDEDFHFFEIGIQ